MSYMQYFSNLKDSHLNPEPCPVLNTQLTKLTCLLIILIILMVIIILILMMMMKMINMRTHLPINGLSKAGRGDFLHERGELKRLADLVKCVSNC